MDGDVDRAQNALAAETEHAKTVSSIPMLPMRILTYRPNCCLFNAFTNLPGTEEVRYLQAVDMYPTTHCSHGDANIPFLHVMCPQPRSTSAERSACKRQ
jgi:hypothetical protein